MNCVAVLLLILYILPPSQQVAWSYENVATARHNFGQVTGMAFGAAGELVVLDAANAEFLVLNDSTGEIIRRTGKRGEASGEFIQPQLLAASETGQVIVFDALAGFRLTAFGPNGTYDKTTTVSPDEAPHGIALSPQGMLRFRAPSKKSFRIPGVSRATTQERHPTLDLHIENRHARQLWEWEDVAPGELGEIVVFRPSALWGVLRDGYVAVASSHEYLIMILDPSGNEIGKIHREVEPQPVTEEARDRALARVSEKLRATVKFGDNQPVLLGIFPGPQGTIMAVRPSLGGGGLGLDVFSNESDYLGTVRLPEAFRPKAGRGGLIAGTQFTSEGKNVVKVLRIRQ